MSRVLDQLLAEVKAELNALLNDLTDTRSREEKIAAMQALYNEEAAILLQQEASLRENADYGIKVIDENGNTKFNTNYGTLLLLEAGVVSGTLVFRASDYPDISILDCSFVRDSNRKPYLGDIPPTMVINSDSNHITVSGAGLTSTYYYALFGA